MNNDCCRCHSPESKEISALKEEIAFLERLREAQKVQIKELFDKWQKNEQKLKKLEAEIKNAISVSDVDDSYGSGLRNGMRWVLSLVDGEEPEFEKGIPERNERLEKDYSKALKIIEQFAYCDSDFVCDDFRFYITPNKFALEFGSNVARKFLNELEEDTKPVEQPRFVTIKPF